MNDELMIRGKMDLTPLIFQNPTIDLFRALFTTDCDYITFNGEHLKGIEENYRVHRKLASLWMFKKAKLIYEVKQVKFLDETTAVVIAVGGIQFRWQKQLPQKRMSISTNVFVKQNNDWKIASFQNARIKPIGLFQKLFTGK